MDQQSQNIPQAIGDDCSVPYPVSAAAPYQAANQHHLYRQQRQEQQQQHEPKQQEEQDLRAFWKDQYREIKQIRNFKNHNIPIARIKKIMKADEDVKMISAEAPVVFSRACEMFTYELTRRAWTHAQENNRRTLQKNDIVAAIDRTDICDFLVTIVQREEVRDDGVPDGPVDSFQSNNN